MPFRTLQYIPFLTLLAGCATSLQPVPQEWLSAPEAPVMTLEQVRRVVADTSPVRREPSPGTEREEVRIVTDAEGARLFRGETPLTPPYRHIESFDVSLDRREIVFSAKREASYDIGLVSLDGSHVNWVPEDPADEVAPRWAPRGHKVSFILRNRGGDLVRTVHIPTAVQLIVDFPFGRVGELAWDPPAERYAVSWETADASQRIEVVRYGGEERRMAVPPAVALDVSMAPFAGGVLLRPETATYGETLPLVVWVAEGGLNRWDDARGRLLREARAAALVIDGPPGDDLLAAVREATWVDRSALYLVDPVGVSPPMAGATTIRADSSVPSAHYRRTGDVISVDPAVVKSFAARFIADQLKGTPRSGHR